MSQRIPLIALIGEPNSGKSTLLNRLTGSKQAVTAHEAHTTRDLNYGETEWDGFLLKLVDTGGLVPDPSDKIQKMVQIKSWAAMADADILVWVIDRRREPEVISQEIIRKIWKTGKPLIIAVNKVDDPNTERSLGEYANLGPNQFVNCSATIGYGLNDFLDAVVEEVKTLGFEPLSEFTMEDAVVEKQKNKVKVVKPTKEGNYVVVRENTKKGPGLYEVITDNQQNQTNTEIKNLIFDIYDTLLHFQRNKFLARLCKEFGIQNNVEELGDEWLKLKHSLKKEDIFQEFFLHLKLDEKEITRAWSFVGNYFEPIDGVQRFIKEIEKDDLSLYFFGSMSEQLYNTISNHEVFNPFAGGTIGEYIGVYAPHPDVYTTLQKRFDLYTEETILIDDQALNCEVAQRQGYKTILWQRNSTFLDEQYRLILEGIETYKPAKILLLGKPNVGKSSLFNRLVDKDIQIVTEIPGTTLSVNDYLLERQAPIGITHVIVDLDSYLSWDIPFEHEEEVYDIIFQYITGQINEYKFTGQYNKATKQSILLEDILGQLKEYMVWNGAIKELNWQPEQTYGLSQIKQDIFDIFTDCPLKGSGVIWDGYTVPTLDGKPGTTLVLTADEHIESVWQKRGYRTVLAPLEELTESFEQALEQTLKKHYVLLDSAGIRKSGQRTMGAETFATYRTVQASYQADVILLMLDASRPIAHQDQVVAGIGQEARKGMIIVANKLDLLSPEERKKFQNSIISRLQFIKDTEIVWISAMTGKGIDDLWNAIDTSLENRQKEISRSQLRKLFNYLMKRKPPHKQRTKKRAVIYDLLYTKSEPPTFELLIKDRTSVHWSYMRFLENIIRQQFDFKNTQIVVKMREVEQKKVAK